MRGEGAGDGVAIVAVAAGGEAARLDLGRHVAFFERQQPASVKHHIGVGDAAVLRRAGGHVRELAAEAAEQCTAGVVFGQPFRRAHPAVAIAGATVLDMEGVQHAVADEPVRAGRLELRVGAIAIERAMQLARQFALDLEERRIGLHRYRREIAAFGADVVGALHRILLG